MASGTRSQIGRIRRILNRRDPILPENGMSSFPSALSFLKIRGISPIKIRIFDYHRFSRPFSLSRPFSASLFHSLSHSLSFLSLSLSTILLSLLSLFPFYSIPQTFTPRVPMKFQKSLSTTRLYFCYLLPKKSTLTSQLS